MPEPAQLINMEQARQLGDHVIVGKYFAFIKPEFFQASGFSWFAKLLGRKSGCKKTTILTLLDKEGTDIAGIKIPARNRIVADLSSITCDKALYRAEEDSVDLLLLNPGRAGNTATVQILMNGQEFGQKNLRLGEHGQGKIRLDDLPAGDYEIFFVDCKDEKKRCKFVVAQYKLVPLVATLKNRLMLADGQIEFNIELTSFGVPVNGPVSIILYERSARQLAIKAEAVEGKINFKLILSGEGPHTLNFQLLDEPSKTASLPVIGSRKSERSQTLLNPLGTEINASLLPYEDSREVRGLHLSEGGMRNTLVQLDLAENGQASLKVTTKLNTLRMLAIDTSFPQAREYAQDPLTATHPDKFDKEYVEATNFFQQGDYEKSLRLFLESRAKQDNPHPYYAYYAACCYAKMLKRDLAFDYLKLSLIDGWNEFEHMENDEDLNSLKSDPRFTKLISAGIKEFEYEDLAPGQMLAIEKQGPLTVLLLAAIVEGEAWEGWTSFVSESEIGCQLNCRTECKSGEQVTVTVKAISATGSAASAAAYLLVKDARLLSHDKPKARLAAAIKDCIADNSSNLQIAFPKDTVKSIAQTLSPRAPGGFGSSAGFGGMVGTLYNRAPAFDGSWGSTPQVAHEEGGWEEDQNELAGGWGALAFSQAVLADDFAPAAPISKVYSPSAFPEQAVRQSQTLADTTKSDQSKGENVPIPIQKGYEPEVLFADFVPLKDGEAQVVIQLPIQEADYIVEAFVIADMNWTEAEARFRAISDPLAEFSLPRFLNSGEQASAFLHTGSRSQEIKVSVYHNQNEVPLLLEEKAFHASDSINAPIAALKFTAGVGEYTAIIKNKSGDLLSCIKQNVDEPGKLRHRVRSLRLLRAGEEISLAGDPRIQSIRVMPGLKEPFNLLLDATTEYGHACCEQTAAKIISACAMFMFSAENLQRKERAEAIIIAGIKREKSMWLPGRGFKTYPERPDSPDHHYGPLAAQYLVNLDFLETSRTKISSDLKQSIALGKEMSSDAMTAYQIVFPPRAFNNMHDAYNACRFSTDGTVESAIQYVRKKAGQPEEFIKNSAQDPNWGYLVNARLEAAYAAASLLRQKSPSDMSAALTLANYVVKSINQEGRLYSTLDSVAAIALFAEITSARILGSSAQVEINGIAQSLEQALAKPVEIQSVRCCEGVATVEVETIVEEDWQVYNGKLPLRVSLEKNGQAHRQFKMGEQVDLRVTLEQGYKEGDLLWVCLPDCLSRIYGGGQVKLFSMDFCGKDELLIPLAVTGSTEDSSGKKSQQSLAICVRNMFEEERGGNPGHIAITAAR